MNPLIAGLVTGIAFGFLLQKGAMLRYEKQLGFLRLLDMTLLKFMFTAILVGAVGVHLLQATGAIPELKVRATQVGANLIGGVLFGIGWALFGLCPGTSVGALGEGRWHVLPGILGMLVGAGVFAEIYPLLARTVISWGQFGKLTLPAVLGVSPWVVLAVFIAGAVAMFRWFEKKGL